MIPFLNARYCRLYAFSQPVDALHGARLSPSLAAPARARREGDGLVMQDRWVEEQRAALELLLLICETEPQLHDDIATEGNMKRRQRLLGGEYICVSCGNGAEGRRLANDRREQVDAMRRGQQDAGDAAALAGRKEFVKRVQEKARADQ
eukprot:2351004-Prymnesium_polylepis.1